MTRFVFRLETVLAWRKTQLDGEELSLRQLLAGRAELEQSMAALDREGRTEEERILRSSSIPAADLWALGSYRRGLQQRVGALLRRREECERRIAAQQTRVAEARRRFRLLERLRERRLAEWQYQEQREREDFAADAFLARWNARAGGDAQG